MPDPTLGTVGTDDPEFDFPADSGMDHAMVMLTHRRLIIRVHDCVEQLGIGLKFLGGVAGDAEAGGRSVEHLLLRTDPKLPVVGVVGHDAELGFGSPQHLLRPLALGDVAANAQRTTPVFEVDGGRVNVDIKNRAILAFEGLILDENRYAVNQPLQVFHQSRPFLGGMNVGEGELQQFRLGIAEHLAERRVDLEQLPGLHVGDNDAIGDPLKEHPEFPLPFLRPLTRRLEFRNLPLQLRVIALSEGPRSEPDDLVPLRAGLRPWIKRLAHKASRSLARWAGPGW